MNRFNYLAVRPLLAHIALMPEQKVRADEAMVESIRAKPVVDETDFSGAPMQCGGQ